MMVIWIDNWAAPREVGPNGEQTPLSAKRPALGVVARGSQRCIAHQFAQQLRPVAAVHGARTTEIASRLLMVCSERAGDQHGGGGRQSGGTQNKISAYQNGMPWSGRRIY